MTVYKCYGESTRVKSQNVEAHIFSVLYIKLYFYYTLLTLSSSIQCLALKQFRLCFKNSVFLRFIFRLCWSRVDAVWPDPRVTFAAARLHTWTPSCSGLCSAQEPRPSVYKQHSDLRCWLHQRLWAPKAGTTQEGAEQRL